MSKPCERCGKFFAKPWNESVRAWTTRRRYCSMECKWPKRVTLSCAQCSEQFVVKSYRAETARFCSAVCGWRFRDEGKRTADKRARQTGAYRAWRRAVFERDDFTCQWCGVRGGALEADHIKPFALHPELRFILGNGRPLCVPCHRLTGTFGRGAIFRVPRCVAVA